MSIFKTYKELQKGVKRAIIVGCLLLPILGGGLFTKFGQEWLLASFLICLPIYWILVFSGVWIYAGFQEDKKLPEAPKQNE